MQAHNDPSDTRDAGTASEWDSIRPAAASATFPALRTRARPTVQDRWERLTSEVVIDAPAESLWQDLTEPARIEYWLARCHGSIRSVGDEFTFDFGDGEYFYGRVVEADAPTSLRYLWRWVGVGPATSVRWDLVPAGEGSTLVRVTEEAVNPPSDWRSWNGNGWPGILDQLEHYERTGLEWRWPWRRMGPYVQIELEADPYEAWQRLTSPGAITHWLQRRFGKLETGETLTLVMGDASGAIEMYLDRVVEPNQAFPSYLPWIEFTLRRKSWPDALDGKMYIEPAGLGRSLFQVFNEHWDRLPAESQLVERRIVADFWRASMLRAQDMFTDSGKSAGPHGWS